MGGGEGEEPPQADSARRATMPTMTTALRDSIAIASAPLCAQRTAHEQTRLACRFTADLLAFCSMRLLGARPRHPLPAAASPSIRRLANR